MKISTSIVIQELLSEQISQLEADITAYQTTFKNAPRAAEIIAHISQERNELLAAKEDFGALPCEMLDAAHLFTYSASIDDISVAQAMMRTHRQAPCAPVCKAAERYDKRSIAPPIAAPALYYSKSTDSRRATWALNSAVLETLKAALCNELFENAAKRGNGDFEQLIIANLPLIVESILGRYQRVFDEVINSNSSLK